MSASVNVGTLESSYVIDFEAGFKRLESRLGDLEKRVAGFSTKTKDESAKIKSEYQKIAASLDPVAAKTQKYEKAQEALNKALKADIIDQDKYNKLLAQAKDRYESASKHTLTWREEIHHLTEKVSGLSSVLGPLSSSSNEIIEQFSGIASKAGIVGESIAALGPLAPVLIAVAVAAAGIGIAFEATKLSVEFIADAVKDGLKLQEIINGLNHTLESNGSVSGLSAKQLVEYAEGLELVIARSKEEIIPAEQILSRFDSLNEKTFPRLLRLTADYAQVQKEMTGADVTMAEAAKKLGPIFEGRTRSLNALKDLGIVFTSGQIKMLQSMVETGDKVKYQSTLFEILDQKIGGSAEKFANTLPGGIKRSHLALDEFKEGIASEVIPIFEDMMNDIVESLGGWEKFKEEVVKISHEVGNALRVTISSLLIFYHESVGTIETLVSALLKSLSGITKAASFVALGTGNIKLFASLSSASEDLSKMSKNAALNALDHAKAINTVTSRLKEHRQALEGDAKVHKADKSAIDSVTSALKEHTDKRKSAIESLKLYEQELKLVADQATKMAKIAPLMDTGLSEKQKNDAEIENAILKEKDKLLKAGVDITNKQVQITLDLIAAHIRDRQESEKITKLWKDAQDSMKGIQDLPLNLGEDRLADRTLRLSVMIIGPTEADIAKAEELLSSLRRGMQTTRESVDEETQRIKDAYDVSLHSAEDMATIEKYLAATREAAIAQTVDDWQTLFDFMGSMFGGVFREIADGISRVQAAYGAGKKLDASGFGSSIGMSGAWSTVLAEVQIFYEVYKKVSDIIKKHRAQSWGDITSIEAINGIFSAASYFNEAGREASNSIRNTILDLVTSMGAILDDMPKIVIRARKDGKEFSAYVAGVFVGTFKDAQAALDAATAYAITHSSFAFIGEEMRRIIDQSIGATLEELQSNIDIAVEARTARLGQEGEAYVELISKWDAEIAAARALGLETSHMIDARNREREAMINSALGIDTSAADRLRGLQSLSVGMGEAADAERAFMQQQIASIQEQMELRRRALQPRPGTGGDTGSGGFGGGESGAGGRGGFTKEGDAMDAELARLQREMDDYIAQLDRIPEALSDEQINLGIKDTFMQFLRDDIRYAGMAKEIEKEKLKIQFDQLKLALIGMGKWEEFSQMWTDAYNDALAAVDKEGTTRKGGGKGKGDKSSVLSFIDQREFELSTRSMNEYSRSVAQVRRDYDEQLKQAGKDKKLRAELIALRDRELAQMEAERIASINKSVDEFLGISDQFTKIRDTAQELIDSINESPLGDEDKASKISAILSHVNDQVADLANKSSLSLLSDLASDLEKYGIAESLQIEMRKSAAILEHTIKMENYRIEIEALRATGKIGAETMAKIDKAFDTLNKVDPTKLGNGSSGGNDFSNMTGGHWESTGSLGGWKWVSDSGGDNSIDPLAHAKELLSHYTEQSSDSFTQELNKIASDFSEIELALGKTPEVLAAKNNAISAALDKFLEPINKIKDDMRFGSKSLLKGEDQFKLARDEFRKLGSVATLNDRDKLVELASLYRELGRNSTAGSALKFIDSEISGVLDKFKAQATTQAQVILGSAGNPMSVESPNLQGAIVTGNTMIVSQLKQQIASLQSIDGFMSDISSKLGSQTMDARRIA